MRIRENDADVSIRCYDTHSRQLKAATCLSFGPTISFVMTCAVIEEEVVPTHRALLIGGPHLLPNQVEDDVVSVYIYANAAAPFVCSAPVS